jgi:hypothetical protein
MHVGPADNAGMDLGDLFMGFDVPGSGRRRERTGEESAAELACLLFLPLAELVVALFLGLGRRPLLAAVILPLALATLAYPLSTRLGTGRGFALGLAVRTFLVCMVIGGGAVLLLGFVDFFQTF